MELFTKENGKAVLETAKARWIGLMELPTKETGL